MSQVVLPKAALPPPICSDVPGTWAYDTMSKRIRTTILAKIPRENELSSSALEGLNVLDEELQKAADTPLRYVKEDGGPDLKVWNQQILPEFVEAKRTWLSAPWAVAEFYFYRRVMEAIGYFQSREDPFKLQKELGLSSALPSITMLASRVNPTCKSSGTSTLDLKAAITTALWGNRMDLSLWPVGETTPEGRSNAQRSDEVAETAQKEAVKMILANDLETVASYIVGNGTVSRVDIVVDNAGFELFCDLCLADYLASSGAVQQVYIQLKAHPTFVSDAMAKDVENTVEFLQKLGSENSDAVEMGNRWRRHISEGRWQLHEDFFWVQPSAFWEMPQPLRDELSSKSSLTFIKGDANYRRLLGDLQWDFETPFEDVVSYFPTPVCPLRTFKAEIACGLTSESIASASAEDPNWLVSGRYGVIQFHRP